MKRFYRIANTKTQQGLWYDFNGKFTGLIHNEFNFCKNNTLEMPFDEEIIGFLSATDTLENLWDLFTEDDILKLEKYGYYIHIFETDDYKWYDKFQHWVINQKNSKLREVVSLNHLLYKFNEKL